MLAAVVALAGPTEADPADTSPYHGGGYVRRLAFADLDGDGAPEMIAANGHHGTISIFPGRTGRDLGRFAAPSTIAGELGFPFDLAVGDFDRDGNMDFAAACFAVPGMIEVHFGDGTGRFPPAKHGAPPPHLVLRAAALPLKVFAVDVNRDGRLDLVAVCHEPGGYTVYLNDGERSFAASSEDPIAVTPQLVPTGDGVHDAVMGDLDRDGLPDLVTANSRSGTVTIQLNRGDGTFGVADAAKTIGFVLPYAAALGDLDGDGVLDLAVVGGDFASPPTERALYRGRGDGTFTRVWRDASSGNLAGLVALADVDGDGRDDLIVQNASNAPSGNSVQVLFSKGMTSDGSAAVIESPEPLPVDGRLASSFAVADLDRDGKLDLAVASMRVRTDPSASPIALLLSDRRVGSGSGRVERFTRVECPAHPPARPGR